MSIQSIIPILLTILSTALGLIPFLLDGPDEQPFWYSLAMGTIEGLLVSVIAIVLVMPVFLNLSTQKHPCYRCHNNCHNSDSLLPTQHQDATREITPLVSSSAVGWVYGIFQEEIR